MINNTLSWYGLANHAQNAMRLFETEHKEAAGIDSFKAIQDDQNIVRHPRDQLAREEHIGVHVVYKIMCKEHDGGYTTLERQCGSQQRTRM